MNSSTLQFLVAGALIAAWAWMLGRPILTNLFRRSRRDSVGHFRYQQAVLGRPLDEDPFSRRSVVQTVLQPLRDWRRQSLERRRLQIMLGFSFATFFSFLMAIAFRGAAIRLFLIMVVSFAAYLGYAAYVGAAQLRRNQPRAVHSASAGRRQSQAGNRRAAPTAKAEPVAPQRIIHQHDVELDHESEDHLADDDISILADDVADPFDGADGFGTGNFDEGFFEPIPELQFAPLNLDASLIQPDEQIQGLFTDDQDLIPEDSMLETHQPEAETAEDEYVAEHDYVFADDAESLVAEEVAPILESDVSAELDMDIEPAIEDVSAAPSFTAPPRQRQRPARKKARPIYIESQLDEADDQARVVND